MVFNNYYCSNAYPFEKESVTLQPHTTTITLLMKRKHNPKLISTVLSVIVCLFATLTQTAHAKNIAPQKAAQIAKKYITLPHHNALKAPANTSTSQHLTPSPYYLFNAADGRGFVIVAGDDAMGEVLAYSKEHSLDTLNANPCVRLLLEGYKQGYQALKEGIVVAHAPSRTGLFTKTVTPLLKSKWGQSEPYNELCGYPYTGCVATAMAQIMRYHRWPAQGKGENGYKVAAYDDDVYVDFSQSHYDWDNMLDDYRYPVQPTK